MVKNIAIIFGKKEESAFNRFSFPVLGKPVSFYPILAANNSAYIDEVYVSTDSEELIRIAELIKSVKVLRRTKSQDTFSEELKAALIMIEGQLGYLPENVMVLLANSPCVTSEMIDNAGKILSEKNEYDSIVTAMRRPEFSPDRIFGIYNNFLVRKNFHVESNSDTYFIDNRIALLKSSNIINNFSKSNNFDSMLGNKVFPVIQNDGVWDIDYIWQVPIVEQWLKQNGFSDNSSLDIIDKKIYTNGLTTASNGFGKSKILITTVPFGEFDSTPLKILNLNPNVEYVINPLGRKLKEDELKELVKDYDILIAGTEPITKKVMSSAPKLKLISRVGIGLDSVDLNWARERGIAVSYTPDAPSPAVAELTIGHMINLLRKIPFVDRKLRSGIWQRFNGDRIHNLSVGIIGTGRVGSRVLKHLSGFAPKNIYVNDFIPDNDLYKMYHAELVEKEFIYKNCDIISLHLPLTNQTKNLITLEELKMMKKGAVVINTSRGGIVNEEDLISALGSKIIAGAALDVFENEPYSGRLTELDNVILSCHMGSMTKDCRAAMEIQATEEALRFVNGEELRRQVPSEEYKLQMV